MLVNVSTDKSVSDAAAALQAAVEANHFGVMQVHNLKETMKKKGVNFERDCLIFEVCQPQQAKKVLEQKHERLHGTAMPDLTLPGGWQDYSGYPEADHPAIDVQHPATGRGGAGRGGYNCEDYERGGIRHTEALSRTDRAGAP